MGAFEMGFSIGWMVVLVCTFDTIILDGYMMRCEVAMEELLFMFGALDVEKPIWNKHCLHWGSSRRVDRGDL